MKLVKSLGKYVNYVMNPKFKDDYPYSKELFAVAMSNKPRSRLIN